MAGKRGNENAQMSKEEYQALLSLLEFQDAKNEESVGESSKLIQQERPLPPLPDASLSPMAPILNLLMTEDILSHIFTYTGPQGTATCAMTCQFWKRVAYADSSQSLWQHFCERTFGFGQANPETDWRRVYAYLSDKAKETPQLLQDANVVFADDGGAFQSFLGDYRAQNVVKNNHRVWCTNRDVMENVDLVVKTTVPTLVSGFAMRAGGWGYTAPLHEALVFCSYRPIDLDKARMFDGGQSWVDRLENSTDKDMTEFQDSLMDFLGHEPPTQGLSGVTWLHPCPPFHNGLTRTIKTEEPRGETLRPLAAFRTQPLPQGYDAALERRIPPTVARHVHFKLLNSHHDPHRDSTNIDVMDLWTYGVPLPELAFLARIDSVNPVVPNYQRRHALELETP